jgi:phosphoenolpyruvate synthase/pyruvate phosphate dikinase
MLKRHHTPVQAIYPIGRSLRGTDVADPANVGFKAYNLMRMSAIGLPVPHGFVLGTAHCRAFLNRVLKNAPMPSAFAAPHGRIFTS